MKYTCELSKMQRIRFGACIGRMREQYGIIIYNYYKACINHDSCKCLVVILNIKKMKIIIFNGVLLTKSISGASANN